MFFFKSNLENAIFRTFNYNRINNNDILSHDKLRSELIKITKLHYTSRSVSWNNTFVVFRESPTLYIISSYPTHT